MSIERQTARALDEQHESEPCTLADYCLDCKYCYYTSEFFHVCTLDGMVLDLGVESNAPCPNYTPSYVK